MEIFKDITGAGHDVVILHGWGCDHRYMQPIVAQLSPHFRIFNYDLPGRGKSAWRPGTKSIHDIADQLLPDLPTKAIYIGWSFGGLVSMSIAARFPERVERFIGISTTPRFITAEHWPGVAEPGFKVPFLESIEQMGFNNFFKQFIALEFDFVEDKPETYQYLAKLIDETKNIDLNVLYAGLDICDGTDLREAFASLKCPIDLILGGKDDCVPTASYQNIQALNPNTNLHIIKDAHHMPFWTHQNDFNKMLDLILSPMTVNA